MKDYTLIETSYLYTFAKMIHSLKPDDEHSHEFKLWARIISGSGILFENLFAYKQFAEICEGKK